MDLREYDRVKRYIDELIESFIQYANILLESPRAPLRKARGIKCECKNKKYDYINKEFCTSYHWSIIETTYIDDRVLLEEFINEKKTYIHNIAECLSNAIKGDPMNFLKELLAIVARDYANHSVNINDYMMILETELLNKPVTMFVYVPVSGIWLGNEYIHIVKDINKNITLRRPSLEEVESLITYFYNMPIRSWPLLIPSTIIEMKVITPNRQQPIPLELYKLLIALSLYKRTLAIPIEIFVKRSTIHFRQYSMHQRGYSDINSIPKDLQAILYKNDEDIFKNFVKWIFDKLPSKSLWDILHKPENYIELAISFYLQSMLECATGNRSRGLMFGVIGLESLFYDGGGEISYKLRMRVTKLLSLLGFDYEKVRKNVKEAYGKRCSYVHGEEITPANEELKKLSNAILEYLRVSIIAFMGLNASKSEIISKIDEAMISKEKEQELISKLNQVKQYIRIDKTVNNT